MTCPLSPIKNDKPAKVRLNEAKRKAIIKRAFELFAAHHGKPYDQMSYKEICSSNLRAFNVTHAAAQASDEAGLNHNQRYIICEAAGVYAWVFQENAAGRGHFTVSWNASRRVYEPQRI